MQNTPTILILGAGFGGLATAIELAKIQKRNKQFDADIVLVDRNEYQLFTPYLYEVAAASKDAADEELLKSAVSVHIHDAIAPYPQIHFIQAEIQEIDSHKRSVKTTHGELHYDYLVLALGSETHYYNIPGMEEHSVPLKSVKDALHIHNTIHGQLEQDPDVHVVIIGGGPSGVEVAAEIRAACANKTTGMCPAVTLVEGNERVLTQFDERIRKPSTKRLQELGIRLKTSCFIAEAQKGKLIAKDGEELNADIIIWTGGVRPNSLLKNAGLELTDYGQLPVHTTLQSKERPEIFACGDNAHVELPNQLVPMTAREAVRQGPLVAQNIASHVLGKPLKNFEMKNDGYVITIGGRTGLIVLSDGRVLEGFKGWFLRKLIDLKHFVSVLPLRKALKIWYSGIRITNNNDYRI